ncbi:hypothetical protein TPHA_0K00560 [Tetrapisispora phaffii CBS 4417]|uniref:Peptide hydrolase n=1 Tax=Tetrapisispora phaffii (strain ATCC 24235 / CBS 4417 / NBRC 1672 / NRRL Y-8282 / UCD 70-5) TaxID=1071381 RepID=G8BZ62_TETPH|nr:hypothetical protein TPHA_0K00560 [Tetrapisispora phaffii CBS 4417]CCE65190.1 hypothetical protein TPHA_0K00560 [Tetrapisispora phaffii CBS 4417]
MDLSRNTTSDSNPNLYLSEPEDGDQLLWEIPTYVSDRVRRVNTGANSIMSVLRRGRSNTVTSIRSGIISMKEHVDKEKFFYLLFTSLFIYSGFMAVFAPVTSLASDFRLLHGSQLTEFEAYRIYLDELSVQNLAKKHVSQYSNSIINPGDSDALRYTVNELEKLGFDPRELKYYPWVNTPIDTKVELIQNGDLIFEPTLKEDILQGDPTDHKKGFNKGYHDYSKSGTVKENYVYVNYGTLEDYNYLLENDVAIENKIHIIRSGEIFRGIQLKNAALFGASGALTYTDPYDDGCVTNNNGFKSFPRGPARPLSSIERGSVSYLTDFPGDPTSNGFPATDEHQEHIAPDGKIPRIPSVPVSAKEIAPILNKLNNSGVRFKNKGGIRGFDYSTGPSEGDLQVRIFNDQRYDIINITNVEVDIPGIFADGTIIIGSHRDHVSAGGAGRASSSSAIFLELARGLKSLKDKGWIPLRPIKLISWDGSEKAVLGSTEFTENYGPVLSKNSLVYINLDKVVTGTKFNCVANPLLYDILQRAAKGTTFKDDHDWSLLDEWNRTSNISFGSPGGGTDIMSFQNYLGIPSVSFGFEDDKRKDAVYPSNSHYDTQEWLEEFVDPDYKLHNTIAKFLGITVLALSEKEMIPFKASAYLNEIEVTFDKLSTDIQYTFPGDRELASKIETTSEQIKLLSQDLGMKFDKSNEKLYKMTVTELPLWKIYKKFPIYSRLLRSNEKLMNFDKLFLSSKGLKERTKMKHSIYAPNKYTGYDSDILPGIHEALIDENKDDIFHYLTILQIQLANLKYLLL